MRFYNKCWGRKDLLVFSTPKKSDAMQDKLQKAVDRLNKEVSNDFDKKDYDNFIKILQEICDIEE